MKAAQFFLIAPDLQDGDAPVKYSPRVVAISESEVMLPSSHQCLLLHLQMADASTNDP